MVKDRLRMGRVGNCYLNRVLLNMCFKSYISYLIEAI